MTPPQYKLVPGTVRDSPVLLAAFTPVGTCACANGTFHGKENESFFLY